MSKTRSSIKGTTGSQIRAELKNALANSAKNFREKFKKSLCVDQPAGLQMGVNVLPLYSKQLRDEKHTLANLQDDARNLHAFLTPALSITRDPETRVVTETRVKQNELPHVDAIFVFGNNDLHQIEHVAELYKKIKPKKVFISGYGGHGTTPGPIFGKTEAETMGRLLQELGVPKERIIEEVKATNSGENVTFTDSKMNQAMTETDLILNDVFGTPLKYSSIVISGTPAGILRQLRSYESQSKYNWENVISMPPAWEVIHRQYYANNNDALINLLCCLREVGSVLDYTVNTTYMSARELYDNDTTKKAIELFVKYYNLFTGQSVSAESLIENFLHAMQQKAINKLDPDFKIEFGSICADMANYFRHAFNMVEQHHMQKLSSQMTLTEQSEKIDYRRTYSRLGLDLHSTFAQKKSAANLVGSVERPISPMRAG